MAAIKTILVPTDFTDNAVSALDEALMLARTFSAQVHLLYVVELPPAALPHVRDDFYKEEKRRSLGRMSTLLAARDTEGLEIETVVEPNQKAMPTAPLIVEHARDHDVDLIVMGTHGRRGLRRMVMGSVAEEVVREADCAVLTVRAGEEGHGARAVRGILVPLDLSPHSRKALTMARDLAQRFRARLHMLHVVEVHHGPGMYGLANDPMYEVAREMEREGRQQLHAMKAETEQLGLDVETHVGDGHPAAYILDYADDVDVDLIVMASHGRTGVERFVMGSVAERVVRAARCPVLVVKVREVTAPIDDRQAEMREA